MSAFSHIHLVEQKIGFQTFSPVPLLYWKLIGNYFLLDKKIKAFKDIIKFAT